MNVQDKYFNMYTLQMRSATTPYEELNMKNTHTSKENEWFENLLFVSSSVRFNK